MGSVFQAGCYEMVCSLTQYQYMHSTCMYKGFAQGILGQDVGICPSCKLLWKLAFFTMTHSDKHTLVTMFVNYVC